MKQRITRCIAMMLVLAVTCSYGVMAVGANTPTFSDVPETFWAYEQIEQAYADGVVTGTYYNEQTGERRFSPEATLTISQFVVILTRAFYASEVDASTATGTWYSKNDAVAKAHNLYAGMETVVMDSPCSRAQMAQLMYNVMVDKGAELPSQAELQATKAKIPDIYSNSFVYHDAIATCYYLGLLVGTDNAGSFSGKISLNRGQSSVVYTRMRDALAALVDPDKPDVPDPDGGWPTELPKFELQGNETVRQMMARINAATPTYREGYLTNGEPISDSAIQAMLEGIKETMPAGTTWDEDPRYYYQNSRWGTSIYGGCNSFAYTVSDYMFGEDAPVNKHQNFDEVKVGDVVYVKSINKETGHVYVVMTNPDEDGYFDTCDGNAGGKVSWTSYEDTTSIASKPDYAANTYIYSRY